ncbi:MAG: hypothetical protein AAGF85_08980 [Bacteroidota bacterium]
MDELVLKIGDNHSHENPDFIVMDGLSDLVADYGEKHFKIEKPSLIGTNDVRAWFKAE